MRHSTWRDNFSYHASGTIPTLNPYKSTNIAQNVFKQTAISSASSKWARNEPFSFYRQGNELPWCHKVNCSPSIRWMTLYRSYWSQISTPFKGRRKSSSIVLLRPSATELMSKLLSNLSDYLWTSSKQRGQKSTWKILYYSLHFSSSRAQIGQSTDYKYQETLCT